MAKDLKFLYETTIKKQVEEPVKETKEENGEKIEITRTVKKVRPIKIAILQPDRNLYRGAELFYSKSLSNYLREGLMPYSLVAKRYANDGGPLTEAEIKRLETLRTESRGLEKDFFSAPSTDNIDDQKKKNDLLIRINEINAEISAIQNAYSDIFDSTAEMKSRNDTIEWWSLFLIYIDEDAKGYQPFFGTGDYDGKIKVYEGIEDKSDAFYTEIIRRLSYLISFWFTAKTSLTKIDFNTMEKLYNDTMSTYKVEESETVKIVDQTPEVPAIT